MQHEDFSNLLSAESEQDWANEIFRSVKKLGFDQTLFAVLNSKNDSYEKAFLKSNYNPDWRDFYDQRRLWYIDPTVAHSTKSITPLFWTPELFTDPQQKEMSEESARYGLKNGIALPIHGPNGEFGVFMCASEGLENPRERIELLKSLPILGMIRDYAFETSTKFLANKLESKPVVLTTRENEVLKWTMLGKSMWEISKILNCSESNVNFHITNVRKKFGVITKHQAILKAVKLGLLEL